MRQIMGFWNEKADGPLDKMFDFNRDGKLNAWERAMELGLLMDDEDDYQDEDDEFDDDDDEEDDESEELIEEDWDSDYDESDEW